MRAFDRSIEVQLALRNMAGRALVIADLRAAGMIRSGREIHVVVAGSAGDPRRPGEISSRLRRARILLMAHFAAPHVRWMDNSRVIMTRYPDYR